MIKINHKILMPFVFCLVILVVYFLNKEPKEELEEVQGKLTFNERVEEKDIEKVVKGLDINLASAEELKESGVSKTISEKIIEYRELTGTIESFSELKRIKGIGDKTLEKIKKNVVLNKENIGKKNKVNINEASEDELLAYGFSKKELENIEKWKNSKGNIFSNIDLIKIVGERRYEQIKNVIIY